MLKTLKVHNFKTFLNTELRFGQRHLLIGKNNSGKTSLSSLLQFVALTAAGGLDQALAWVPGGIAEVCNWNLKSDEIEISCACVLDFEGSSHNYIYELRLSRSALTQPQNAKQSSLRVVKEQLTVQSDGFKLELLENDGRDVALLHEEQAIAGNQAPYRARTLAPKDATMLSRVYEMDSNRRTILFRNYLRNWRYFSLSPMLMRIGWDEKDRGSPTAQAGAPPFAWWTACDPQGSNLSQVLFILKSSDDRRYRRFIQHVKMVEPDLEAINYLIAPGQQPVPFVSLIGQPRGSWPGLSDGTLRAMGLALIIETSAACSPPIGSVPSLSIVEEPENGIFPGLLRRFFDLFEEWAPTSQFLFTSHSPYFIDMFDNKRECVTILRKAKDRTETIQPPQAEALDGEDRLTLSAEYASELFQ